MIIAVFREFYRPERSLVLSAEDVYKEDWELDDAIYSSKTSYENMPYDVQKVIRIEI